MMEEMKFNPLDWAQSEPTSNAQPRVETVNDQPMAGQVDNMPTADFSTELQKAQAVCDQLLSSGANIAESYEDYLKLGFSLVDGLGPEGRDIYHALCAQSSKYRERDCEKKWQECLSKHDGRTTIRTFYKMAQDAGVDLSEIGRQFPAFPANPQGCVKPDSSNGKSGGETMYPIVNNKDTSVTTASSTSVSSATRTAAGLRVLRETQADNVTTTDGSLVTYSETFSDKLDPDDLPVLLRMPMLTQQEAEDRDKVVLSGLVEYSGNLPNVYGIYGEKRVSTALYFILNAPSGARKGIIDACRQLLMPIEYDLMRQNQLAQDDYQRELANYNARGKSAMMKPEEPPRLTLFMSANSSATSLYEDMADNGDGGTIFETEADTMTQAMRQDYGNYSEGLRKAFHGERITYSRRKEHEHVCLEHPHLAILMTCTPMQIARLLPADEVENGLANRFLYYCLRGGHGWRSPFAHCEQPLEDRIYETGKCFHTLYSELRRLGNRQIQVVLSEEQQQRFDNYFSPLLEEQTGLHGDALDAFIYRMGLSAFRMMMVLTTLRCFERQPMINPDEQALVCTDTDFQTVMTITDCLVNHTVHVYTNLLPHATYESPAVAAMTAQEKTLYLALDDDFTTQAAFAKAKELAIPGRTAERYLGDFVRRKVARRISNGHYQKVKAEPEA